jgi:uncharacterized protein YbjT (DUF2867 family)/quercetin dioxygenase-like cupin family protein
MKLTVIGGTGLIGSQVVQKLTAAGHQAVPAALSTGLDLITGKGLDQALEGADVAVNVANSPTFDEASVDFFRTSMNNLLAAGERTGVRHQVVLSIVGVDQVPQMDYYRAKTLQEDLLRQGPTPYSIVRATQFFEFMNTVVSETSDATSVRLPSTRVEPIASADVADAVVEVSTGTPLRGIRNVAGPDVFPLDELGRVTLAAQHDNRTVITDDKAGMFAGITGDVLTAGPDARLAATHYQDWLESTTAGQKPRSNAWQSAITVVQEVEPPFIPAGAHAMTIVVQWPPGHPGNPPHRHPGPAFGYVLEGEMVFELEGEPARVVRAGEAFWEPGGDVIHYQDGNNRDDIPVRFTVTMLCEPGQPMLTFVDEEELVQRQNRRAPRTN